MYSVNFQVEMPYIPWNPTFQILTFTCYRMLTTYTTVKYATTPNPCVYDSMQINIYNLDVCVLNGRYYRRKQCLITVQEILCAFFNLVGYTVSHRYIFKVREGNLPLFIYRYFCSLFTKSSYYDTVKSSAVIKEEFRPHFLLRT